MAKAALINAHEKYDSILENRRVAMEDNEDNEVLSNVM